MSIKANIKKAIERSSFLSKMIFLITNRRQGDVSISGVNIRNNTFTVESDSSFRIGKNCNIRNNAFKIYGANNRVVIGNSVQINGRREYDATILILGNNNRITVDDDCRLTNVQFFIRGNDNAIHIHSDCSATYTIFHIEQDSNPAPNTIDISEQTTIHGRQNRCTEFFLDEGTMISVGKDCMISNNVQIRTTDSHSVINMAGERINKAENIDIGNHCWIGMDAALLKGVKIRAHSIVAAGAICTKKYDKENVIIGGCPASVIKENVDWTRAQIHD